MKCNVLCRFVFPKLPTNTTSIHHLYNDSDDDDDDDDDEDDGDKQKG